MFLKTIFAASAVSSLFVSVAQAQFYAPVFTNWIAVVGDGYDAHQCAAEVTATGKGAVTQILSSIGILSIQTPSSDNSALTALPCLQAIERDIPMSVLSSVSPFAAVVKDNFDVNLCSEAIQKTGVTVTEVLPFVGIVLFEAATEGAQAVGELSCVLAVEEADGEFDPNGVAGVMN